jgi:hypothetical protein
MMTGFIQLIQNQSFHPPQHRVIEFGSRFHEISPMQLRNSLAQGLKNTSQLSRETGGDWTMFEEYVYWSKLG